MKHTTETLTCRDCGIAQSVTANRSTMKRCRKVWVCRPCADRALAALADQPLTLKLTYLGGRTETITLP